MSQKFKNIYFADYPSDSSQKKNLTLAFGAKDTDLYSSVRSLSSQEMRELVGFSSYSALQQSAEQEGLAINTYLLRVLRGKKHPSTSASELPLDGFPKANVLNIDPIQATFKGGQAEPLHTWYPFLEGYSPGFVEQILLKFAPKATKVIDPFSGTGTTPLTVAILAKQAFYCELNPLLQYLTAAKIAALSMNQAVRGQLIESLVRLSNRLEKLLASAPRDAGLEQCYSEIFGASRFFEPKVYDEVLQMRSAIDSLACEDPTMARFLTVSVLASLIPSSRLIRRGDVRYKTSEEMKREGVEFLAATKIQIARIAADLEQLGHIEQEPTLICEDARALGDIPPLEIDTVITSPPYLNGTNYFRNTKIELWFLRCLRSSTDLSSLRRRAITAGINDVTNGKANGNVDERVRGVVTKLEATAYDPRIPKMVAAYFTDMTSVFGSLRKHLTSNAVVVVDIGDSSYSGVHVPTDRLLEQLLLSQGYTLQDRMALRARMSRTGFPLHQVLLVFNYARSNRRIARESFAAPLTSTWSSAWTKFKKTLPHQQGDFAKRNWGHSLHSLCSYQGKMKPSLASHLVRTFLPTGGTLLDPFAGVGTIPFEAALQGSKTWAFEISPPALHITRAKLGRPDKIECGRLLDNLEAFIEEQRADSREIESAQMIHFNGALADYFETRTFHEILLARRYFIQHPPNAPSESLVLACLLHILHGNRPYALSRRSHPITPFAPSGPAEYRSLMKRLRDKVYRSLNVAYPDSFLLGQALFQDATSWWPQEIDRLDAIITSPPFFDSTRFYLANWMRLWFCGWEANDFRIRPLAFVDERQKSSFAIYDPIFRQARERLKPGGIFALHLGKSRKCDMADVLSRVAASWFRTVDVFSEDVTHCESHGIRDKGTVQQHQYLILQ